MISWLHDSGISGWWKYSAYLSAFLSGERTPRCALARSNLIYICAFDTCLHIGDSTTPLLSAQRVSLLRFVGINKQNQTRIQDGFHMSTWFVEAKKCAEGRLVIEPRAHLSQLQSRKQGQQKHHHANSPGDHATPNTIPIHS